MQICGLQKLTLLDYPGKLACTIFTLGCEFKCPFCHNSALVINTLLQPLIKEEEIIDFLKTRKGKIDGVCLTGGEPLLQQDLESFIKKIKDLGFQVKLDTNGYLPDKLINLVEKGLVDYVAMDIKNSLEKYGLTAGLEGIEVERIKKSIAYLKKNHVPYEFRTTAVREYHSSEDFIKIASLLKGSETKYFIQNFVDSGSTIKAGLHGFTKDELVKFQMLVIANGIKCEIRGVD